MAELDVEQLRMLQLILRDSRNEADKSRKGTATLPERKDVALEAIERLADRSRRPR